MILLTLSVTVISLATYVTERLLTKDDESLQIAQCISFGIAIVARDDSHILLTLFLSEMFRKHTRIQVEWWQRMLGNLILSPVMGTVWAIVGVLFVKKLQVKNDDESNKALLMTFVLSITLSYLTAESTAIGSGLISLIVCGYTLTSLK